MPSRNFSSRRVYWASQETIATLTPTATNTAGSFDLATDGILVCGAPARGQTFLWTTTDLWGMTYIGGDLVYSFARLGTNCGIVGRHAFVVIDTGAYWMGNGKFFVYDGFVRPIPCDVTDYVFESFNTSQQSLVWAFTNPKYGEVTWFYPSANSSVTDRYVTYNYQENHWTFGTLTRTCGITQQAGGSVPVLIGSDGTIYDHETGTAHGGVTPFLESGPFELNDGNGVYRIQRIVPDDETLGDVQAYLYTTFYPDQAETQNGPYSLADPTSVRLTARQFRLRIEQVLANAWRVGIVRLGAVFAGRR